MKQLISLCGIFLFLIILSSCSSVPTGEKLNPIEPPEQKITKTYYLKGSPVWKSISDIKKDLPGVSISGSVVNLNGARISGRQIKRSSNANDENSIPLKIDIDNFTLKNGVIEDIPGGILSHGKNNTYQDLIFLESGEDFLSTPSDRTKKQNKINFKVIGCRFYNDKKGDKSLQMNNADGALVDGCFFTGGETAIRVQESSDPKKTSSTIKNTSFDNVATAMNVAGQHTLTVSKNTFKDVPKQYSLGPKAKLIK